MGKCWGMYSRKPSGGGIFEKEGSVSTGTVLTQHTLCVENSEWFCSARLWSLRLRAADDAEQTGSFDQCRCSSSNLNKCSLFSVVLLYRTDS